MMSFIELSSSSVKPPSLAFIANFFMMTLIVTALNLVIMIAAKGKYASKQSAK